jgi:hypothetical protein
VNVAIMKVLVGWLVSDNHCTDPLNEVYDIAYGKHCSVSFQEIAQKKVTNSTRCYERYTKIFVKNHLPGGGIVSIGEVLWLSL